MKTEQPPVIRLSDYTPPAFAVERVTLDITLSPTGTIVMTTMIIDQVDGQAGDIVLEGEGLVLKGLYVDGEPLAGGYEITDAALVLRDAPARFELRTEVSIDPQDNTRLEGLYLSNGVFCTQCEAEGFRRITYFPDRPDVMTTYTVTIRAEKSACPVLLSNGNNTANRDLGDGWHESVWHDPFPKPSYLFALVAGGLDVFEDRFTTRSGRQVDLKIWVEPGNAPRCAYAMEALKRAMRWDEDRFGLEYDLDIFNIVAVSDFNMGAMENKSLNVFNAKYILADPETATDSDFEAIEAIVGHEYFHNWTGNRVTCRDWFQLSLKEGLTVFRDQEFTADMRSRAVKRIQDVRMLRARQFPEDAGPLAHPVRPDSYMEINNFYTATVYEKGAELIRMLHGMLGEDGFQAGMHLYFKRHDGQAVTCDDFVAAMADATETDLTAFKPWYSQAGTPQVIVSWEQPGKSQHPGKSQQSGETLTLTFDQHINPTPGQEEKQPLPLPIRLGLVGPAGERVTLLRDGEDLGSETLITLEGTRLQVRFDAVPAGAVPSINRGFSAPVILKTAHSDAERAHLMGFDPDPFARWEAGQQYATTLMLTMVKDLSEGKKAHDDPQFIQAMGRALRNESLDPAFRAQMITLPSEAYISEQMRPVRVDQIHAARKQLRRTIGETLKTDFEAILDVSPPTAAFDPGAAAAGRRALANTALAYLGASESSESVARACQRFDAATNMTDRMAALAVLSNSDGPERQAALDAFETRFANNEQVMDKWFSIQAMSERAGVLNDVVRLTRHPAFSMKKPNKVRALIGAFAMGNPAHFHAADGSGYNFVIDRLIELDRLNPQVAARMLGVFGQWRRLQADRGRLMRTALERMAKLDGLSRDCTEIATKSLHG